MLGGDGLLSTEEPIHGCQRKMLNPQFSYTKLKSFVDIFSKHATEFNKHMAPVVESKQPVDMGDSKSISSMIISRF